MTHSPVTPQEAAKLDKKREQHQDKQPYAAELDAHELEHAHKDQRPVNPKGEAAHPAGKKN